MFSTRQLEVVLKNVLPSETESNVSYFAGLVTALAQREMPSSYFSNRVTNDPVLTKIANELRDQKIVLEGVLMHFHGDPSTGYVSVKEIDTTFEEEPLTKIDKYTRRNQYEQKNAAAYSIIATVITACVFLYSASTNFSPPTVYPWILLGVILSVLYSTYHTFYRLVLAFIGVIMSAFGTLYLVNAFFEGNASNWYEAYTVEGILFVTHAIIIGRHLLTRLFLTLMYFARGKEYSYTPLSFLDKLTIAMIILLGLIAWLCFWAAPR